jgi:hypothetical protein
MGDTVKATEGNGGAPIVLRKDPARAPDYPRGLVYPKTARPLPGADRLTFDLVASGARITYHDVQVISDGAHTAVQCFVGPHDVVTWEWL